MKETLKIAVTQDQKGQYAAQRLPSLPNAVYSFGTPVKDTKQKPSSPHIEDLDGEEYVRWGSSDLSGTQFRQKIDEVPLAGVTIRKQTQMMYGNGIVYYKRDDLKKGNKVERHYDPKIEDWLERNRIHSKWLPCQIQDYRLFLSCFGEVILSNDLTEITGIRSIRTEFSRKDLHSKNHFFSYEFPRSTANNKNWIKSPLIPEFNLEEYFDNNKNHKLAYHSYYPTSGSIHYPCPPWFSLGKEKGWLDVSSAVPNIIDSMQRNQIMIKYQINVPISYFETRYADWTTYNAVRKKELMETKIDELNTMLSDTNNLYKSISTVYYDGETMSDKGGLIDIIPIDDKTKNDSWVPSSNASDAQIVQGLEMHPSQIGLAPEGGKMGAGSGSDQRESYNTVITLNTIDQLIVLEPLNMISNVNDWGVVFRIDHTHHTTTNNQESGLQPSDSTTEVKPAENG